MPIQGEKKIGIINGSYSMIRISDLTLQPGAEETELALFRLENMAREFEGRNICTGYNFEDVPQANSLHNMKQRFWEPYQISLASRLVDFGRKTDNPQFQRNLNAATSFLYSNTADPIEVQYPSRQARGSGATLRYNRWQRFFRPTAQAPQECETKQMYIDDIRWFVEHFDAYLTTSESISTYTIEANQGLTILSDSQNLADIDYEIQADGAPEGRNSNDSLQVKIQITTTLGRKETRIINFKLHDSRIRIDG